jgi:hypothetical protein
MAPATSGEPWLCDAALVHDHRVVVYGGRFDIAGDPGQTLLAHDVLERHAVDRGDQRRVHPDLPARFGRMTQVDMAHYRVPRAGDPAVLSKQHVSPLRPMRPRQAADHVGGSQEERCVGLDLPHREAVRTGLHCSPADIHASAIQGVPRPKRQAAQELDSVIRDRVNRDTGAVGDDGQAFECAGEVHVVRHADRDAPCCLIGVWAHRHGREPWLLAMLAEKPQADPLALFSIELLNGVRGSMIPLDWASVKESTGAPARLSNSSPRQR